MYRCSNCNKIFEEPLYRAVHDEINYHYANCCPYCSEESFRPVEKCESCGEAFEHDDFGFRICEKCKEKLIEKMHVLIEKNFDGDEIEFLKNIME